MVKPVEQVAEPACGYRDTGACGGWKIAPRL